jgi:uncharacterized coiled-coil protein SlyX
MDEATLEQIQTRITFLERANGEISAQLYRQHQEISALTLRLAELADRLHAAMAEERVRAPEEERPPHY